MSNKPTVKVDTELFADLVLKSLEYDIMTGDENTKRKIDEMFKEVGEKIPS